MVISTFGVVTYECVFRATPVVTVSHNNISHSRAAVFSGMTGCSHHLGLYSNLNSQLFSHNCSEIFHSRQLATIQNAQKNKIDGKASDRIWSILLDLQQ